MKSIMEEASSIMEAIQKGWERAGKPQEFSVKVFEEAQTAFFGMRTVKSAKVALFFKEGTPSLATEKTSTQNQQRPSKGQQQPSKPSFQKPAEERHRQPHQDRQERNKRPERQPSNDVENRKAHQKQARPAAPQAQPAQQKVRELPTIRPIADQQETARGAWTDEMVNWVGVWLKQTLAQAGHPNVDFSTESSRNLLRIDFVTSITGDEKKERILFSSFAHLIMSSLRNKFKGDLKHLKVVLNSK